VRTEEIKDPKLLQAAEKGNPDAQFKIAQVYLHAHNMFSKAEQWYTKAAHQGHARSMMELASFYHLQEKNLPKAIHWYQQASKQEDSEISGDAFVCMHQIVQNYTPVTFEEFMSSCEEYLALIH
jgi:TPR repeat protein